MDTTAAPRSRRRLRKILKIFGISVGVLVVAGAVAFWIIHKPLPEGKEGPEAEALADKMLAAVNAEAWSNVRFLAWDFPRGHSFVVDQKQNVVEVKWDDVRVMATPKGRVGVAYKGGKMLEGAEAEELVKTGIHYYWNDGFWLYGFLKVRDPGTRRAVVDMAERGKGLLVTYDSGGTTPGDSYLWLLDQSGRPYAWQMWVDIIPFGGLEFSWEEWAELPNGARYAKMHDSWILDVPISDVRAAESLPELNLPADLFEDFFQHHPEYK